MLKNKMLRSLNSSVFIGIIIVCFSGIAHSTVAPTCMGLFGNPEDSERFGARDSLKIKALLLTAMEKTMNSFPTLDSRKLLEIDMGLYPVAVRGTYEKNKLFIKTDPAEESIRLNELRWAWFFSEVGIGPKLHGLVEFQHGVNGMALEYIDGQVVMIRNANRMQAGSFKVTAQMKNDIRAIGKLLKKMGVKYATDMQFFLAKPNQEYPNGRALIFDAEYFSMTTNIVPDDFLKNIETDPEKAAEAIANSI
ncbi:MAG: hypothetical protein WA160_14410 [Pseudobdellovibrio sp.]